MKKKKQKQNYCSYNKHYRYVGTASHCCILLLLYTDTILLLEARRCYIKKKTPFTVLKLIEND